MGQPASGSLFTGWFEPNLMNSVAHFGVPFTGKPDAFQGWYKYTPGTFEGNTDTAAIYAVLSRWNGSARVEIARAELYPYTTVGTYTYFNLPFEYVNALQPDTIAVVFASSKHGDIFEGGAGSKLFIDNINLFYDLSPVQNLNIGNKTVVFAYDSQHQTLNVMRSTTQTATVELFDITGKKLRSWQLDNTSHELPCTNMIPGVYVCRYSVSGEKPVVSKLYIN